jgi:hypothetical protein
MGDYHDFKFDQHYLYSYQTLKILNKLSQLQILEFIISRLNEISNHIETP